MSVPTTAIQSSARRRATGDRHAPVAPLVRRVLLFEAATFVVAAATHLGALLDGYAHARAATAETVR